MTIERRIRRLRRRIARIDRRLAVLAEIDELGLRGPLKRLVERIEKHPDIELDQDGDGKVDFQELVDGVVEFLDEETEPDNRTLELISDLGLDLVAEVAVMIYRRTEHRLRRRRERLQRRLRALKEPAAVAVA